MAHVKVCVWGAGRGAYGVEPELDDGRVVELADLRSDGDAPLLFVPILLIPLP